MAVTRDADCTTDERRAGVDRGSVLYSALLVLLAVGNGLFCAAVLPETEPWVAAAGSAALVAASLTVPFSRRWPLAVVLAAVAASTLVVAADTPWRELAGEGGLVWTPLALAWVAAHLAGAVLRPAVYAVGGAALLVPVATTTAFVTPPDGSYVFGALGAAAPILGGTTAALTQRLLLARRDRLRQAERERALLAERTRVEERKRLAAEMHDVVSHQVSLMVLQAGALGVASGDTAVRAAADEIRAAGSRAIDELRGIIGVLRDDRSVEPTEHPAAVTTSAAASDGAPPDPTTLVGEARGVGQNVVFSVHGDPAGVAPHTARALFRIVQEALTNTRKHAPGAEVTMELRYRSDAVLVSVVNEAPTAEPDPMLAAGSGTGLEGLRQRVDLIGGTLNAAPTPEGGFSVDAVLPLGPGGADQGADGGASGRDGDGKVRA